MAKHIYVATRGSGLRFAVIYTDAETDKEVRFSVKFVKGQFSTEDEQVANAIDKLMDVNMNIRSHCKKADQAAAEKMALDHLALTRKTGAHKGGVSTDAMKAAMSTEMQQRDSLLKHEGVDNVAVAKDESLILTEKGATQPSPDLNKLTEDAKSAAGNVLNLGANKAS